MPVLPEKREEGGAQVSALWNSCGGIGRKCAFYNGFTGSVPTKFDVDLDKMGFDAGEIKRDKSALSV